MTQSIIIYTSKTYKVRVGCGNLYITVDYKDGAVHKLRMQRNTKFKCSHVTREHMAKQATFQSRRDTQQLIKDLTCGEVTACESYNIAVKSAIKRGELGGYSCGDAIAKVVKLLLEEEKSKQLPATSVK